MSDIQSDKILKDSDQHACSDAKALTKLLGGEIAFESREGQGSHFWVDLPFETLGAGSEPAAMGSLTVFAEPVKVRS